MTSAPIVKMGSPDAYVGSAIGPVLGGTLVKLSGYPAIGSAAVIIDFIALTCFWRLTRPMRDSAGVEMAKPTQ